MNNSYFLQFSQAFYVNWAPLSWATLEQLSIIVVFCLHPCSKQCSGDLIPQGKENKSEERYVENSSLYCWEVFTGTGEWPPVEHAARAEISPDGWNTVARELEVTQWTLAVVCACACVCAHARTHARSVIDLALLLSTHLVAWNVKRPWAIPNCLTLETYPILSDIRRKAQNKSSHVRDGFGCSPLMFHPYESECALFLCVHACLVLTSILLHSWFNSIGEVS